MKWSHQVHAFPAKQTQWTSDGAGDALCAFSFMHKQFDTHDGPDVAAAELTGI